MKNSINHENRQSYITPYFVDKDRLLKIKALLPKIDKAYHDYAEKKHYPGYAFGVMVDGQLIHSGSSGYINLKEKIPATPQSMFRIASMTKSFTAMAILKLRDEHQLKLDDKVDLYIPEIKNQRLTEDSPDITIRDLLIHATGFPTDDPWADRNLNRTESEVIELLKQGLSFATVSGTSFDYSNLAYTLLGIIIQKVSGISYQEYVTKNIWEPLDMKQASWEFSQISPDQLAQSYRWLNGQSQDEEILADGIFGAMGGMITSIESFSRYVALHQAAWPPRNEAEKGPIKRSSIREMHQPWRLNGFNVSTGLVSAYGYGLRWLQDSDKKTFIGHGGGLPGFGSHWFIMPDYGIGLILLANTTYAVAADEIHLPILQMLIAEASLKPRYSPPSEILKEKQQVLMQLLPDWGNVDLYDHFSDNFFLDNPIDNLVLETRGYFDKVGKILKIEEITAENQTSGSFIIKGELSSLKINILLSPHLPALIQKFATQCI